MWFSNSFGIRVSLTRCKECPKNPSDTLKSHELSSLTACVKVVALTLSLTGRVKLSHQRGFSLSSPPPTTENHEERVNSDSFFVSPPTYQQPPPPMSLYDSLVGFLRLPSHLPPKATKNEPVLRLSTHLPLPATTTTRTHLPAKTMKNESILTRSLSLHPPTTNRHHQRVFTTRWWVFFVLAPTYH